MPFGSCICLHILFCPSSPHGFLNLNLFFKSESKILLIMSTFVQLRVSDGFVLPEVFDKLLPDQTEKALKLIAKLATIGDSPSSDVDAGMRIATELAVREVHAGLEKQYQKELASWKAHYDTTINSLRSHNDSIQASFHSDVNAATSAAVDQRTKQFQQFQTKLDTIHAEEIDRLESKIKIIDDYTHRSSAQKGIDGESKIEDIVQEAIACETTSTARFEGQGDIHVTTK